MFSLDPMSEPNRKQDKSNSHHDLETIEASSFRGLDFTAEALDEVFVDNAIRGGEKGENVRDEVALIVVELVLPVVKVL
jgi:hypothetical protein